MFYSYFLAAIFSSFGADLPSFPPVYNTQKETIPLLKPEEALRQIHLPDGFEATLFAAEPDVRQPIGMCFDARGRLWVAENYTYAESSVNFATNLHDRILIFEDADHDGRFDKRTVFWDRAEKLTSVAVGFGGVYVMAPPRLLFIPDANRDDIPDQSPQVLLDGFDADKIRHTLANGLKWGPDGWLYGRHGIQGTSFVGAPGTPREKRVPVNGSIWRFHPVKHTFELVAQGTTNPWGADWDENGELFFINTVIGHLWHAIPGSYFKRMYGEPSNRHIYELIDQVADHVHWDTRERWDDIRKGITATTMQAGGGHAHTGLLLYQGDNWPREYRNELFTLNYHGKRINHDHLERAGADYVGKHRPELLSIDDPWFRGIDLLTGPDGGVYIADWSDIGECHDNDGIHRTSGRIYKVTYGRPSSSFTGDLARLGNLQLVKLLSHPNEWFVREARQLLQERTVAGDNMEDARAALREMFANSPDTHTRLRALWAMYATDALTPGFLREQLTASDEHLRVWTIRLFTDRQAPPQEIVSEFTRMARNDPSGLVLSYLASALQRLPLEQRWPLASALGSRSEFRQDRVLPLMVWYGIEPALSAATDRAADFAATVDFPVLHRLAARRAFEDLQSHPQPADALVALLNRNGNDALANEILAGAFEAVKNQRDLSAPAGWAPLAAKFVSSADPTLRSRALDLDALFGGTNSQATLIDLLTNRSADRLVRERSLNVLLLTHSPHLTEAITNLLTDPQLAAPAIRALASRGGEHTAGLLLDCLPNFDPAARRESINALASREHDARALLNAIQRGKIKPQEIGATQLRQLRAFNSPELKARLAEIWPQTDDSPNSKKQLFARYRALLTTERLQAGNLARGQDLFRQTCGQCHKLFGEGATIGPELTGADRHNLDYLLDNILNPSAVVPDAYRVSVVSLRDDRVLTGIVTSKTPQNVIVQTVSEKVVLPVDQIESIKESELSMMPEGILDSLTDQQVTDLIAYLMSSGPVQHSGVEHP